MRYIVTVTFDLEAPDMSAAVQLAEGHLRTQSTYYGTGNVSAKRVSSIQAVLPRAVAPDEVTPNV